MKAVRCYLFLRCYSRPLVFYTPIMCRSCHRLFFFRFNGYIGKVHCNICPTVPSPSPVVNSESISQTNIHVYTVLIRRHRRMDVCFSLIIQDMNTPDAIISTLLGRCNTVIGRLEHLPRAMLICESTWFVHYPLCCNTISYTVDCIIRHIYGYMW